MGNYDSWRKALELPYASLADSYDLYGDELRAFRGRRFRVADPTGDNISRPPPPGYYWVRVDNNAVLAAVATGVVVDIAYNLFH